MSILNVSFNASVSHLTCATETGYIIYSLNPLEKKIVSEITNGIGLIKIHNKTNISILVGGGTNPYRSKDTIILWDENKKKILIEINMKEHIKNGFISKDKMMVVLSTKICVFKWTGTLIDSKTTYNNDKGVCAYVNINDNLLIASLGVNKGEICIWKVNTDNYKILQSHKGNIEVIALNNEGTLVATASETGTIIRVYNTNTLKLEYELRRGSYSAKIHDICFNDDSTLLACHSGNGTIHIFELHEDINSTKNVQSILYNFKDYLPTYFSSLWAFKQINIGETSKAICIFDSENNLHMATYNGNYYRICGTDKKFEPIVCSNLHVNSK